MDVLKSKVADYLNDHPKELSESGDHVDMSLFMMGKVKERSKPMIMIVSNDKTVRTQVVKLIRGSGIMKDYAGFGVSHMDLRAEFECLQPLGKLAEPFPRSQYQKGDEGFEVFTPLGDNWSHLSNRDDHKGSNATAGGVIAWEDRHLLHTVSHFLDDYHWIGTKPRSVGTQDDSPDIDLEDMRDITDDTDVMENIDGLAEITSHGSMSPVSLRSLKLRYVTCSLLLSDPYLGAVDTDTNQRLIWDRSVSDGD
jgi:hypothetical protein